jgi:hypothetical protein
MAPQVRHHDDSGFLASGFRGGRFSPTSYADPEATIGGAPTEISGLRLLID